MFGLVLPLFSGALLLPPGGPPPCALECEVGLEQAALAITCESGAKTESFQDQSQFDYGPSGERNVRLTLERERTYTDSGHTYRIRGWIRIDRTAGQVSYEVHATGGALGGRTISCQAGPSAPEAAAGSGARPAAAIRPGPDAALSVAGDHHSAIVVPECDRAQTEGRLPGDTWACLASEKGEYVGRGKLWLLPSASHPATATYTAFGSRVDGRVDVKVKDGEGQWEARFSPPRGEEWKAGRYQTQRDGFQDEGHAGLSLSAHSSACGEETGVLELLELHTSGPRVTRLRADVEQTCQGKRLRGRIRFTAP